MDKIVGIKRKAQRFVQSGDLARAVAEYERLVESGEMDPYDFVYLGDLLTKINRLNDAVDRYRDAISAYERVGLYKNAIAVGKKILRIKPESFDIHRLVGGLYFLEGLYNDSLFYYMQFLSSAPPESETGSIEEVGLRLLGMPLPSPEVALNIVATMVSANCATQAARPLLSLAVEFEQRGAPDWAEPIRRRAFELDPSLVDDPAAAYPPPAADPEILSPPLAFEPPAGLAPPLKVGGQNGERGSAGVIEHGAAVERAPRSTPPDAGHATAANDPGEFGMIQLRADGIEAPPAVYDIDEVAEETPGPGRPAFMPDEPEDPATSLATLLAEDSDLDPEDFHAMVRRGEEHLAAGDTARGLNILLAAGRTAFNAGESRVAEKVYSDMVKLDPNHLEALQGLTEIAHINGERAKIVRYGCELGDVLLAREQYAAAKLEFERVLQFDPRNEKAKARVTRLNSIDGMEQVTARPLAPVASEMKGATVTVRNEPARTQSILDLSEIMSEFQSAVASQFPVDDAQSHYDLGMTYHEMGMVDQAVAEFEIAAESELHRSRALEMIARCLISAGRAEEALRLVEDAASSMIEDQPERQANLFACRGLALEALGRAGEALHALERALAIDPALEMAKDGVERLRGGSEAAA